MSPVVALHLAATLLMTGLIWFVQVVHYPLFAAVEGEAFRAYAVEHQRRTSWLVVPTMVVEAATAAILLLRAPGSAAFPWLATGFVLLAGIWASTGLLQVPLHGRLVRGFDDRVVRRLVATNWLRTVGWSARSVIAFVVAASGAS